MLLTLEPRQLMSGDLPAGMTDDLSWINAHANTNVTDELYSSPSLINVGTNADPLWDQLRPYSFQSQGPTTSTSTYTADDGTVSTLVTHGSVSASYSSGSGSGNGSGSSSGDYGWTATYVRHDDSTDTITGVDATGHPFNEIHSRSDDINWQGSGDSSGTAHYKLSHDGTTSDTRDVTGGSARDETASAEGHVTVNGDVSPSGTVSGDYTLKGDFNVGDTLSDGGGSGSDASGLGYTADYSVTSSYTLAESGNYLGGTDQVSSDVKDAEKGNFTISDASGSETVSRDDHNEVQAGYSASGNASPGLPSADGSSANAGPPVVGGPATQGPVDTSQPKQEINFPKKGVKSFAYVIDVNDAGSSTSASGDKMKTALEPHLGPVINGGSLSQAVKDLGTATSTFGGKVDVLIVADHGYCGNQQMGSPNDPYLTPSLGGNTPLDQLVAFVNSGGSLLLTGCETLGNATDNGQAVVNKWQAYATARNITITGSVSYVYAVGPDKLRAVWVTLVPGGTAPKLFTSQ